MVLGTVVALCVMLLAASSGAGGDKPPSPIAEVVSVRKALERFRSGGEPRSEGEACLFRLLMARDHGKDAARASPSCMDDALWLDVRGGAPKMAVVVLAVRAKASTLARAVLGP